MICQGAPLNQLKLLDHRLFQPMAQALGDSTSFSDQNVSTTSEPVNARTSLEQKWLCAFGFEAEGTESK